MKLLPLSKERWMKALDSPIATQQKDIREETEVLKYLMKGEHGSHLNTQDAETGTTIC